MVGRHLDCQGSTDHLLPPCRASLRKRHGSTTLSEDIFPGNGAYGQKREGRMRRGAARVRASSAGLPGMASRPVAALQARCCAPLSPLIPAPSARRTPAVSAQSERELVSAAAQHGTRFFLGNSRLTPGPDCGVIKARMRWSRGRQAWMEGVCTYPASHPLPGWSMHDWVSMYHAHASAPRILPPVSDKPPPPFPVWQGFVVDTMYGALSRNIQSAAETYRLDPEAAVEVGINMRI